MEGKKRLQEIAAKNLGGKPEDYEVANERVFRKGGGAGMTFAQAAQNAIQLGGIYDGHEAPEDINKMHQGVGRGARRPGLDRRGAGTTTRTTARRIPSSPASPRSKSTSKPASTTSWISWPWPTSAP